MSSFEFLSVLISVVVGLGMANMLKGIGEMLHKRHTIRFSVMHLVWTIFVFVMMIIYWWTVVFGWKDWQNWNILLFMFVLIYGVILFLLCAILYPGEIPESWDPYAHFIDLRRWFFGIMLVWVAFELTDTWLKEHFDDFGVPYLLLIGFFSTGAVIGYFSAKRRVQNILANFYLAVLLSWLIYQLRDLEWSATLGG